MGDQLIYSNVYDKTRDEIIDLVGINLPFVNPYYIFFSLNELMDDSEPEVYFIGYEMKPSGPSFWGYIDKKTKSITIDDSCIYKTYMLNDMVKAWKSSNYVFGVAAVENRMEKNLLFRAMKSEATNNMSYEEFRRIKISAAYLRGEIDVNEMMRKYRLKPENLEKFLEEDDAINFIEYADKLTPTTDISINGVAFKMPELLTQEDYSRFKAYYALKNNSITQNQFNKIYPWEYTLDIFNNLLYYYFNYEKPPINDIEESLETGDFENDYPGEMKLFLNELNKSILRYEEHLNRFDLSNDLSRKSIGKEVKKFSEIFFTNIQNRNIKFNPTTYCPTFEYCNLTKNVDECKVYFYPEGHRNDHLA